MKKIKANNPVGELVTVEQMAETSNLGVSTVRRIAEEAQAVRRIGRIYLINRQVFLNYIEQIYS